MKTRRNHIVSLLLPPLLLWSLAGCQTESASRRSAPAAGMGSAPEPASHRVAAAAWSPPMLYLAPLGYLGIGNVALACNLDTNVVIQLQFPSLPVTRAAVGTFVADPHNGDVYIVPYYMDVDRPAFFLRLRQRAPLQPELVELPEVHGRIYDIVPLRNGRLLLSILAFPAQAQHPMDRVVFEYPVGRIVAKQPGFVRTLPDADCGWSVISSAAGETGHTLWTLSRHECGLGGGTGVWQFHGPDPRGTGFFLAPGGWLGHTENPDLFSVAGSLGGQRFRPTPYRFVRVTDLAAPGGQAPLLNRVASVSIPCKALYQCSGVAGPDTLLGITSGGSDDRLVGVNLEAGKDYPLPWAPARLPGEALRFGSTAEAGTALVIRQEWEKHGGHSEVWRIDVSRRQGERLAQRLPTGVQLR